MQKTKIYGLSFIILLVLSILIQFLFLSNYKKLQLKNFEQLKLDEYNSKSEQLKDFVYTAYSMIEKSYNNTEFEYDFESFASSEEMIKMLNINRLIFTLENLREIKFDSTGFITINDFDFPYVVRLHSQKPVLEGSDWVFYVNKQNPVNIYELIQSSVVEGNGEAIFEYDFYELNSEISVPMLCFAKLFDELDWVISSSVDISELEIKSEKRILNFNSEFNLLKIKILILNFIVLTTFICIFLILKKKSTISKIVNKN